MITHLQIYLLNLYRHLKPCDQRYWFHCWHSGGSGYINFSRKGCMTGIDAYRLVYTCCRCKAVKYVRPILGV